ncbi:hypothetical protein JNB88_24855 [Rhizobium cauense]|uniref:hypothetical protein n=1 Tax=Rhizobium cauense TaxID=1166683 RepID=UPI001C6DE142|nr:hypothetical protein [Rhizobium cauense]MBW9116861.1 hypothetical protein [Rhizobium cauense]
MRAAILGVGELAEFIVGQISNHTSLFEGLAFRSTAGDLSLIDVTLRDPVELAVASSWDPSTASDHKESS